MFDLPPDDSDRHHVARGRPKAGVIGVVWSSVSLPDLLSCRDQIMVEIARQVPIKLADFNVEAELLTHFHSLRSLHNLVVDDDEVPANQKAQVANAVTGSLDKVAALQNSVYDSERFKRVENLLIRHLSTLEQALAEKFLTEYEQILGKVEK
jgi:hypothetical protein